MTTTSTASFLVHTMERFVINNSKNTSDDSENYEDAMPDVEEFMVRACLLETLKQIVQSSLSLAHYTCYKYFKYF